MRDDNYNEGEKTKSKDKKKDSLKDTVRTELVAIKGTPHQRQLQMQLLTTSLLNNEKMCQVLRLHGSCLDRKEVKNKNKIKTKPI